MCLVFRFTYPSLRPVLCPAVLITSWCARYSPCDVSCWLFLSSNGFPLLYFWDFVLLQNPNLSILFNQSIVNQHFFTYLLLIAKTNPELYVSLILHLWKIKSFKNKKCCASVFHHNTFFFFAWSKLAFLMWGKSCCSYKWASKESWFKWLWPEHDCSCHICRVWAFQKL